MISSQDIKKNILDQDYFNHINLILPRKPFEIFSSSKYVVLSMLALLGKANNKCRYFYDREQLFLGANDLFLNWYQIFIGYTYKGKHRKKTWTSISYSLYHPHMYINVYLEVLLERKRKFQCHTVFIILICKFKTI